MSACASSAQLSPAKSSSRIVCSRSSSHGCRWAATWRTILCRGVNARPCAKPDLREAGAYREYVVEGGTQGRCQTLVGYDLQQGRCQRHECVEQ